LDGINQEEFLLLLHTYVQTDHLHINAQTEPQSTNDHKIMPDLTLSSQMDAFLAETDPAAVFAIAAQGALADSAVQPADLGDSASLDVGTTVGTVAAGNDARFTDERVPTAAGLTSKFSTNKATIVNGDKFTILDSAASDVPKHTLWSLIVSTLTTAFNALYVGLTGNQTVAGNKTLSGQTELTGQAATNSTSAMTRELVKTSPFEIPDTIQLQPLYSEGTGTGTATKISSLNGCYLTSGTSTSSGAYAIFLSEPHYWANSGNGINYDTKMEFGGNFRYDYNSSNAAEGVARFLVGNIAGHVFSNADAFTVKGVGFEIASRGATSNEARIRLIYHDGSTYKTSAWSNFGNSDANYMYSFYFVNEGNGTITLTVGRTGAGEGIGARSAGVVTISANDAPTGVGGNTRHNVTWACVNSSAAYTAKMTFVTSPVTYRQGN
jgi:hypothetical protein